MGDVWLINITPTLESAAWWCMARETLWPKWKWKPSTMLRMYAKSLKLTMPGLSPCLVNVWLRRWWMYLRMGVWRLVALARRGSYLTVVLNLHQQDFTDSPGGHSIRRASYSGVCVNTSSYNPRWTENSVKLNRNMEPNARNRMVPGLSKLIIPSSNSKVAKNSSVSSW